RREPIRQMTHFEPRMATLLLVRGRAAPVLLEEHREPFGRGPQIVLGIHLTEEFITGHAFVKRIDDQFDGGPASDRVVEAGVLRHRRSASSGLKGSVKAGM